MIATVHSRFWILAPLTGMFIIQVASGVPDPDFLKSAHDHSVIEKLLSKILFFPGNFITNLLHVPAFLILTLMWCLTLPPWIDKQARKMFFGICFSVPFIFSMFNELSQLYVPTRFASVADELANVLGILSGLFLYSGFLEKKLVAFDSQKSGSPS